MIRQSTPKASIRPEVSHIKETQDIPLLFESRNETWNLNNKSQNTAIHF